MIAFSIRSLEQQISVAPPTGPGDDKFPLFQLKDVLAHRVLSHLHCFPNGFGAGLTLAGPAIRASFQETVDRQISVGQSQLEHLIGEKETISIAVTLQPPPPV